MALPPWLPAPTPFEPRLQVGAWLTLWCWAGAPLLPALPWLGSLLSGCIGLAKASRSASGGSSQALWSETCKRNGQRVSAVPLARAQLTGALPSARAPVLLLGHRARQSLRQGTAQSCWCRELALAPLSKGSCSTVGCVRTSSELPPGHGRLASCSKARAWTQEPSFPRPQREWGAPGQPGPSVSRRIP